MTKTDREKQLDTRIEEWRGTPIPEVRKPITPTPTLERIAATVWWNGPPWTILRNRDRFLCQVMDWASTEDTEIVQKVIPDEDWTEALRNAQPGQVSRGICQYYRLLYGVAQHGDRLQWESAAHRLDWRPYADDRDGRRFRERVRLDAARRKTLSVPEQRSRGPEDDATGSK